MKTAKTPPNRGANPPPPVKTWGYTGAEAFGGVTQQCNMPGGMGGCQRWLVTKEFQCTGMGNKDPDGGSN
ncbi:YecR family lipoprotein [Pseudoxanthomonas mexicana]